MEAEDLTVLCARLCTEFKAENIVVFDMRTVTDVTDYLVIATLETRVQMRALLEAIDKAAKARGVKKLGVEGTDLYRWVLIDFVDCVVHLFDPEARAFYELETLWGDAATVDWQRQETA